MVHRDGTLALKRDSLLNPHRVSLGKLALEETT
jgi:hypothetical protein